MDSGPISGPLPILSSILPTSSHSVLLTALWEGDSNSRTFPRCFDSLRWWNQCLGKLLKRVGVLEWKALCYNSDLPLTGMFPWTISSFPRSLNSFCPSDGTTDSRWVLCELQMRSCIWEHQGAELWSTPYRVLKQWRWWWQLVTTRDQRE